MKILIISSLLALCGCSATNVSRFATAMGKDHATWIVNVNTIYGSGRYVRIGDNTNVCTSVNADGVITQTPLKGATPAAK